MADSPTIQKVLRFLSPWGLADSSSLNKEPTATPAAPVSVVQMRGCRELIELYPDALVIKSQIEVIEASLPGSPGVAFTHCRGLLESVCQTILADRGVVLPEDAPAAKKVVSEALKCLKLTPTEFDGDGKVGDGVGSLLKAVNLLIHGVVELRASQGVGPHGKDAFEAVLDAEYAVICACAVDAVASLLFRLHRKQAESDPAKRLRYGDHPGFDAALDKANSGLKVSDVPVSASKALYYSDLEAYRQKLVEHMAGSTAAEPEEEFAEGESVGGEHNG
jgi:hypothetical protein